MKLWTFCERCGGFEQVLCIDPFRGDARVPCPGCNGLGAVLTECGVSPPQSKGGKDG